MFGIILFGLLEYFVLRVIYKDLKKRAYEKKNRSYRSREMYQELTGSERLKQLFLAHLYFWGILFTWYSFVSFLNSSGSYRDVEPDIYWGRP